MQEGKHSQNLAFLTISEKVVISQHLVHVGKQASEPMQLPTSWWRSAAARHEDGCTCDSTARRGIEEARTHRPLPIETSRGGSIPKLHLPTWVSTKNNNNTQERRARRGRTAVRLVLARTASQRPREADRPHHHWVSTVTVIAPTADSRSGAEHVKESLHRGGGRAQEETRRGQHTETIHSGRWNLWLGGTLQAHAHSGLKSFANRARPHLTRNIPLQKQTLICCYSVGGKRFFFSGHPTRTRNARQGEDATKTPRAPHPAVRHSLGSPPLD